MINQTRADQLYSKEWQQEIKEIIPKWYNELLNEAINDILNNYVGFKVYNTFEKKLTESQFNCLYFKDDYKYRYKNIVIKAFNLLNNNKLAFKKYTTKFLNSKNYTSKILIEQILNGDIMHNYADIGHTVWRGNQYGKFIRWNHMQDSIKKEFISKMKPDLQKEYEQMALDLIKPEAIKKLQIKLDKSNNNTLKCRNVTPLKFIKKSTKKSELPNFDSNFRKLI